MNRLNFEDSIFILNMRIRMIKDTLRLTPPPELFMERCLDDLAFVNGILDLLVHAFVENDGPQNGNGDADYLLDTEWQYNQLLTEFSLESSPFPAQVYPEVIQKIALLRDSSNIRRKTIEETIPPSEIAQAEPVVTSAELNGLLGGV
jgi:hypothetical protein